MINSEKVIKENQKFHLYSNRAITWSKKERLKSYEEILKIQIKYVI